MSPVLPGAGCGRPAARQTGVLPVSAQQPRATARPQQASDSQFISASSRQPLSSRQSVDAEPPQQSSYGRQQWEPQKERYEVQVLDAKRQQRPPAAPQKSLYMFTALFAGATLVVAVVRVLQRYTSPAEKHVRDVDKNRHLVETLSQYLPNNRVGLDTGVVARLRRQTGFSGEACFRKYLWFLLRERKFDVGAVEDMVLLKSALGLSGDEVAGALHERAQRIYQQYGNVMLEVKGMTKAGIDRKATCRALFSKLLYLQECEELLEPGSPAVQKADIPGVFGATEDDTARLRIVSLHEVDFDSLEAQFRNLDAS